MSFFYRAMFGHDVNIGLSSSSFPQEVIANICSEEELEKLVNEFTTESEQMEKESDDGDPMNNVNL